MLQRHFRVSPTYFPVLLGLLIVALPPAIANPIKSDRTAVNLAQTTPTPSTADLQAKATTAIQLWANQEFAKLQPYLSPGLQALLPPQELQRFWQEMVADVGQIKTIGQPKVVSDINANFAFVPVEFERLTADVVVTFNASQEIAGINFPTRDNIQAIAIKSIDALSHNDLVQARDSFHPRLKAEISPQQLEQKWLQLQQRAGAFQRIVKSQVQLQPGKEEINLVLVTLEFAQVTEDLIVIFDRQKQIVGVDFPIAIP